MMDDLISRQAALDWLKNEWNGMVTSLFDGIKALPTAQPDSCEDAVSRQRLLSDLKELTDAWKKYPVMAEQIKGVEAAIGYVEAIPSVKPDSKELSPTHKALDTISRQAAIDALCSECQGQCIPCESYPCSEVEAINALPSAQSGQTDCDYCHEDSDGYVRPIEKNGHAVIFGSVLYLKVKGWSGKVQIKYCPMCGRRLER